MKIGRDENEWVNVSQYCSSRWVVQGTEGVHTVKWAAAISLAAKAVRETVASMRSFLHVGRLYGWLGSGWWSCPDLMMALTRVFQDADCG